MDKPLYIVADDLTGAADSAARWLVSGAQAEVWLTIEKPVDSDIAVALSSDSRFLPPDQAAEAVHRLVAALQPAPGAHWYKKIDSTLRGNLVAEIEALLDALMLPYALICPAFPAQGRGLYHGILVCDPDIAPATDLHALFTAHSNRPIARIPLELVREGPIVLAQQIANMVEKAVWLVADALTDLDLTTLVAAAAGLPQALLCGSAGLLGAIAQQQSVAPPVALALSAKQILVVVGSGSQLAHAQLAQLQSSYQNHPRLQILHLPPPPPNTLLDTPTARRLAEELAKQAALQAKQIQPDLLILVGGDTTYACLHQLGVTRLHVLAELQPGIVLTTAKTDLGQLQIILKAGSFGTPQSLVEVVDLAYKVQSIEYRL